MDVDRLLVFDALAFRATHPDWQVFTYQSCGHTYIRARRGSYVAYADDLPTIERLVASYESEFNGPIWKAQDWTVSP